ncbi:uncharacterized protein AMSG_09282 [Thecamonas trahens ATCC 50062]|uniref:EGF-like domain-containing protein n=1 Tax=Thecamonas trahens ATCC 50062 TaxID=461836 RepID=A0A0L0DP51_THETB|nr:hypothetical protein AMSG_09282 [Thecamonas trahens ATCC 50062]KNC53198.1 hypothetical protein AMSG_09282 [Thecamonas trahens ATCC 50062]|eukprot:XP_013754668.1 hypothetical protein AMSG_09282 [Thecamonas trahens ATCC 50062]
MTVCGVHKLLLVLVVTLMARHGAATTFSRSSAFTFAGHADFLAATSDPDTSRAYFFSFESPTYLVEIDTAANTVVWEGSVSGLNKVKSAGFDANSTLIIVATFDGVVATVSPTTHAVVESHAPAGRPPYFALVVDPARSTAIVSCDQDAAMKIMVYKYSISPLVQVVGENLGDRFFTMALDPVTEMMFGASLTKPTKVAPFSATSLKTGTISSKLLESGEDFMSASLLRGEGTRTKAYFGTDSSANFVVEVDVTDPAAFFRTGRRLFTGSAGIRSAAMDPTTGLQYWGANSIPVGFVYLVNATSMELVETLTLNTGEKRLQSAVIDVANERVYFGTQSNPAQVIVVETATCPNNCNAASSGGVCTGTTCNCNTLRAGFDCSIILCPFDCYGPERGVCNQGVCECTANFTGQYCEERRCEGGCGEELNHGVCNDGTCECVVDNVGSWNGRNCDQFSVACNPPDCSGHGVCPISLNDRCDCDVGWQFSPLCNVNDADAESLTVVLELSKPYNRSVFLAAVAYELDIDESCIVIKAEPPENPPDTVTFTIIDCGNRTGPSLVRELVDVLTGKKPARPAVDGSDSELGRIGVTFPAQAPPKDTSGATGVLIGVIVAAVVVLGVGIGSYMVIKRKLLAKARAAREAKEFESLSGAELNAFGD